MNTVQFFTRSHFIRLNCSSNGFDGVLRGQSLNFADMSKQLTSLQGLYDIFLRHPQISKDSRQVPQGSLYWSLKGERFDGNQFAQAALDSGAAYAVVDDPDVQTDPRLLLVADGLIALQELAAHHRRQLGIPLIAITGSNGKTTTKELMRRVLSKGFQTFATPGNYNNHIGLPLSILQLTPMHQLAILELGANHIGENAELCNIAQPDFGLITNMGKDHLEGFGSIEGVEQANAELFDYLRSHEGTAFVNEDDIRVARSASGLLNVRYSASTPENMDLYGSVSGTFPYLSVRLQAEDSYIDINTHLFGSVNIYNILAAAAAGIHFNISLEDIKSAIESYQPDNNRSQIIRHGSNTYILDAYNANPSSMEAAIRDFAQYPAAQKVLILGDMFELGTHAQAEHEAMLALTSPDMFVAIILIGPEFMRACMDEAHIVRFRDMDTTRDWFHRQSWSDTTFLLKGSRSMKMEALIDNYEL